MAMRRKEPSILDEYDLTVLGYSVIDDQRPHGCRANLQTHRVQSIRGFSKLEWTFAKLSQRLAKCRDYFIASALPCRTTLNSPEHFRNGA
jgi:hypothetical protein